MEYYDKVVIRIVNFGKCVKKTENYRISMIRYSSLEYRI